MNTSDLIEKLRRYPIPSISVALILVCLVVHYFRIDLTADLEAQLGAVQETGRQVDDNIRNGARLQEHVDQMRSNLAALEQRVVQPSELANNMNYFYQIESNSGVTLGELRQHASSDKPAPKNKLGGVGYTVTMSGEFPQVVGALDELENGSRFYRMRGFSLERGRDAERSVVMLALNLELLGWQP